STGASVSAKTNAGGNYNLPYLVPSTYTLIVEMPGFKKVEKTPIELRVNDILDVDFRLQVGNAVEVVNVAETTPLLDNQSASQDQAIDSQRVHDLPLQAGNANELTLFSPGVVNTTNLRQRKTFFGSASSQFSSDGNRVASNEYNIDGVPSTFASNGTPQVAFQPPEFSVSEFRVRTSGYDAELGHSPGAVINVVTNSGTDQYHGELHEFFSNSALDTPTYFQNRTHQQPVFQDNRYGASIGGPVRIPKIYNGHGKTFFFYAWEANKLGKPITTTGTVPTDAEKHGDFSALTGVQIFNPFTTTPASNGRFQRQQFVASSALGKATVKGRNGFVDAYNPACTNPAGCPNIIPIALIDPVAAKILSFYHAPNTVGAANGVNNYIQNAKDLFDYYVHFVRLDHNFSEKNRAFLRLDYDHNLELDHGFYDNTAGGVNLGRINRGGALDDVLVLSNSTVLDLHYGVTDEETPEQRLSTGIDLSSFGFSPALLSLLNSKTETFPNIFLNSSTDLLKGTNYSCNRSCIGKSFSGFGNFNNGDGNISGLLHQFAGTLTTTRGNHDLHYGAEFRLYRSFAKNRPFDVSPGFQFLANYTNGPFNNSAAAPIGQELASLELGIPTTGQITRSASYAIQNTYTAWFLQDNWRIIPKLTINAGLRLEHESPVTERFDRSVRGFDTADPNPIAPQAIANYAKNPIPQIPVSQFQVRGGLLFAGPDQHNLWDQPTITWLPRFGIVYQLDKNTVVRSGFGIFYDTIGVNRSAAIQTGFTATTTLVPTVDNGQTFVATLANPFPNGLSTAPVGASGGLATALGQSLSFYPTSRLQPYSQRWSFDVQRLLPADFLLDVGYVGNKAIHVPVSQNINPTPQKYLSTLPTRDQATINTLSAQVPNPFFGLNSIYSSTIQVADLLRPFPEFGDIIQTLNNGSSWYHALQVRSEKRFSHGYTLNAAYTWARLSEATSYLNDGDVNLNRAISSNDRRHRVVVSGIWELPVGRGRAFFSEMNAPLNVVLGNWQFNGSYIWQGGAPLSFGDFIFNGSSPDQINLPSDQRSVDHYINTSLFERSSSKQRQFDIRTFPRMFSSVRGPSQLQFNVSAFKDFNLSDRWKLQFRAECYDLLNHANFNDPSTSSASSSSFGTITGQGSPSREFQLALKLSF
ncbi:MAG TPA: carboxypeptidase-like regulatory domain-containing protein, partial [Terriglobales bacterium]|nr:carboxypeptidase-like regulatory domain-containing protein [Terriglobales bacterium]